MFDRRICARFFFRHTELATGKGIGEDVHSWAFKTHLNATGTKILSASVSEIPAEEAMGAKGKSLILASTALVVLFMIWWSGFLQTDTARPPRKPPLDRAEIVANLRTQASRMQNAILEEDYERAMDLTLPAAFDPAGGRTKFIETLKEFMVKQRNAGVLLEAYQVGDPSNLVEHSGDFFGIVPYKASVSLRDPQIRRGHLTSFLIGVSTDGGRNWKFIDGGSFHDNPSGIQRLIPNFPTNIQLPAKQAPTYEDGK